jgi:hypothetical protein
MGYARELGKVHFWKPAARRVSGSRFGALEGEVHAQDTFKGITSTCPMAHRGQHHSSSEWTAPSTTHLMARSTPRAAISRVILSGGDACGYVRA